ncbi:LytTR family DNA-binding domain-containing protein [Lysobacter sp. Root604]|uniref:LytR/AlgR family response regulator transcription factor n=1 Tax=Lysobacter sp. Root604 TaxID=1736568 RepID=UPI0006FBF8B9|nr:LytTR family DNA-binding domain-containing protein [Lysobacter sp. Root604]KRA16246.1 two-component system response regulator [Lysobacter sp. Root604]
MKRIRTLIVDDEPLARRGLELRLGRHSDIEIVGEAGNGRQAFYAISSLRPQLMFLDVQMPGIDGFDLLRMVPATQIPLTVFVTAYDHYASAAFAASALDYLLKPVDDARLDESVERARGRLAARETGDHYERLLKFIATLPGAQRAKIEGLLGDEAVPAGRTLTIRDGARLLRIELDSIRWVDAAGDYMCLHAGEQTHVLRGTMQELEQRLDPRKFARIHRSTIVNLARVQEMRPHVNGEYFLRLDSGHELKLSRSYRDKIKLLT